MENNDGPTRSNGKICYLEILSFDVSISSEFYKRVFNWRVRQRGDGVLAFDDTVGEVSGTWVLGRTATKETGILIYIMVDDINKTVGAILANGGKIVQPVVRIPETIARFSDPAGNIFGLYQEPKKNK